MSIIGRHALGRACWPAVAFSSMGLAAWFLVAVSPRWAATYLAVIGGICIFVGGSVLLGIGLAMALTGQHHGWPL
jgi:hypothetical protein